MLVVEQSEVMCIVDPPGSQTRNGFCEQIAATLFTGFTTPARTRAIESFLTAVKRRPGTSVTLAPFETNTWPGRWFPPDDATLLSHVRRLPSELVGQANLQQALEDARTRIEGDLLRLTDAERTRTHYVVVVLSTGVPSPRCSRDDLLTPSASAAHPELIWPDSDQAFCNLTDLGLIPPLARIVDFVPGGSINQNSQLFDVADALVAMERWYGVRVSLHTRLVLSERSVRACGALCDGRLSGGMNLEDSRAVGTFVLGELARRTGGTFLDPGEPANLTLQDLATMEPTTFCGE